MRISRSVRTAVVLTFCLDYPGVFEVRPDYEGGNNFWPSHPYNAANGGPCQTQHDFFTNNDDESVPKRTMLSQ